jgi:hypothetical protein
MKYFQNIIKCIGMITATITALFGIVKENVKEEYKNNINKEKENLWKKTIN